MSRMQHITGLSKAIGPLAAVEILARRVLKLRSSVKTSVRGIPHPIEIDPLDSDLFVASQIFGWKEYNLSQNVIASLNDLAAGWAKEGITPIIIDGGANVGYSPLYFAATFPTATIVAVEADKQTIQTLKRNCAPEPRIAPLHAALWSHDDGVIFGTDNRGSWSHHVAEEGDATPSLRLDSLMARYPNSRLLILKLDIEGAENTVVAACPEVVRASPCIMIEPHDFMHPGSSCLAPLYAAITGRAMDSILSGENLFLFDSALSTVN
jgi:FkbM family methyltransferase